MTSVADDTITSAGPSSSSSDTQPDGHSPESHRSYRLSLIPSPVVERRLTVAVVDAPCVEPEGVWDPNAPDYRCCCGLTHVKKAAQIVTIVDLILLMIATVVRLVNAARFGAHDKTSFGLRLGFACIDGGFGFPIMALCLWGLAKERRGCVLPFIGFLSVHVMAEATMTILAMVYAVCVSQDACPWLTTDPDVYIIAWYGIGVVKVPVAVVYAIVSFVNVFLTAAYLFVVFKSWIFLRDKQRNGDPDMDRTRIE